MKAGRLDRQITIEYKSITQDPDYGTELVSWLPLSYEPGSPLVAEKYAANVQDVLPSRSEAVAQGLTIGRDQTRMRIRWRDDVTSAMRVTLHGDASDQIFEIVSGPADFDGRKTQIEFMCERYTS